MYVAENITIIIEDNYQYQIDIKEETDLVIEVSVEGVSGSSIDTDRIELESLFNFTYLTAYSEFIYNLGDLSKIEIYEDNTKVVHLFTKDIAYISGNISTIKIINEINSKILIKTFAYDIDGNIESITKVYI